jgi:hypothetical protein
VLSIAVDKNTFYTYGGDQIIKGWSLSDLSLKFSLFITKDYEWIMWDGAGNYTASSGGEQYLNWQINRSERELAQFFDVSTYAESFLKTSPDQLEQASRDQLSEIELPEKPEIQWIDPSIYQTTTNSNEYRIKARVVSDEPIKKVRILIEGVALPNKRSIVEIKQIDQIIELKSYRTVIQIYATTESAKVVSEKRVILNPNMKDSRASGLSVVNLDDKPNLYFLGIGISDFQNSEWNLTYADDDANSMYDIFASNESPVFNEFYGKKLLNEDGTRENIINGLNELADRVRPIDQVISFMASHGINDQGFYYILTHDADKNDLRGTCVNWNDISQALANLPCRVLFFVDTCHSGALGSSLSTSEGYLKNTEALRQMGSNEVGVVIMSASTGEESSLESAEWQHGVFTLSLIQGLKNREADMKKDGLIYLRELDLFVADNVYTLTNGQQNPTTQKPSTISKLIIY